MLRDCCHWAFRAALVVALSAVARVELCGQTAPNPPPATGLFQPSALPALGLAPPDNPPPAAPAPAATTNRTEILTTTTRDAEAGRWGEFSPYQQKQIAWAMRNWDPYPAEAADRSLGQQILETILPDPSNVHIGQLQIGGGVVTTVREKNPFGLLNMEVFHVSY
jgi:hypothetical protein